MIGIDSIKKMLIEDEGSNPSISTLQNKGK